MCAGLAKTRSRKRERPVSQRVPSEGTPARRENLKKKVEYMSTRSNTRTRSSAHAANSQAAYPLFSNREVGNHEAGNHNLAGGCNPRLPQHLEYIGALLDDELFKTRADGQQIIGIGVWRCCGGQRIGSLMYQCYEAVVMLSCLELRNAILKVPEGGALAGALASALEGPEGERLEGRTPADAEDRDAEGRGAVLQYVPAGTSRAGMPRHPIPVLR